MLGASPTLLSALSRAVSRRADMGWGEAARAKSALAAIEKDAAGATDDRGAAFERIARIFRLGDDERAVLEIASLTESSTPAHLLLGLLSGDAGPAYPTVSLVLELAGLPSDDATARRVFAPTSRLLVTGLVELQGDAVLLSHRVVLADRVAAHVAGSSRYSLEIATVAVETMAVAAPGTADIAAALRGGERLVWVTGPSGSAGAAMSVAACDELGVQTLVADLALRPGQYEHAELVAEFAMANRAGADALLAALLLEAGLRGAVLVVLNADQATPSIFDRAGLPVIAVSSLSWNAAASPQLPTTVRAPRLTIAERQTVWSTVLPGTPISREVAALRLTPEQIIAVGEHAERSADFAAATVDEERIRVSARLLGRRRSHHAVAAAADPVTLDDLVLPAHALAEVQRLIDWARYRDEIVARGPLHGKGGKGSGISALFAGAPGTGKTLAAHVIADALALDLYQVEIATVVDKYIGETEKNLEKVFQDAEAMNALLFFDEADAIFGSRSEVKDARDRYANQEVAYLLQRMEQFDGITILASNLRGNLDQAFARRLHFIVNFPDPDEPTRVRLWEHHLAVAGPQDADDPIDVAAVAKTAELSGGDIRNIVLSATYAAVAEGVDLGMRHIVAAARREFVKLRRHVPPQFLDTTGGG
jgi:hypothetical protein